MAQVQIAINGFSEKQVMGGNTYYHPTQYFDIPANAGINSAIITYVESGGGNFEDKSAQLNASRAHSGWVSSGKALNVALLAAGQNSFRWTFRAGNPYGRLGISSAVLTIDYTPSGSPNPVLPVVSNVKVDGSSTEIYRDANADVFLNWSATQGTGGGIYRYDGGYWDDGGTDVWPIGTTTNSATVKSPPAGVSRQFFIMAKADGGDSLLATSPFVHSYSAVKSPTTITVTPSTVFPGASVNISWSGAENGKGIEIVKYEIFRNDAYLGETTGTTFTTTALGVGSYVYKVYAIGSRAGYSSGYSVGATLTVAYPLSSASLNKSTVPMDDASTITLTVTPGMAGYTHAVMWYPGDSGLARKVEQNIAAGATTATLTVPSDWIWEYPSTSGTALVRVIAYSGDTGVGIKWYNFSVTVPDTVKPTVSLSVEPVNGFNDLYLKGISRVTLDNNAVGAYGSSIIAHSMYGGGYSGNTDPWTSGILGTVGSNVMTATVTDSRNRQATAQQTITVLNYNNPVIKNVEAVRCNADGTENRDGLYAKVKANLSVTAIAGNSITGATIHYKKSDVSNWYWTLGASSFSSGIFKIIGGALDITSVYDIKITLTDTVGNATPSIHTALIPSAIRAWDMRNDRTAFGRIAGGAKTLLLPDDWSTNVVSTRIPNQNILHNWDFRNPVNQRGLTGPVAHPNHVADRWTVGDATVAIGPGYLVIADSGAITQRIEGLGLVGKTCTVSIDEPDGQIYSYTIVMPTVNGYGVSVKGRYEITGSKDDNNTGVLIKNVSGGTVWSRAVKLELGTVSTLAYDPPMDYGAEFTKCQRYFRIVPAHSGRCTYTNHDASAIYVSFSFEKMRITPTVIIPSLDNLFIMPGHSTRSATGWSTNSSSDRSKTLSFNLDAPAALPQNLVFNKTIHLSAEV